jgi:glycosyltransferase involved in cell wall biosynthesis
MATAAEQLLSDDARRARLAEAGAELVRKRFDWDNAAAVLEPHLEAYVAEPQRYQRPPADVLALDDAG